ncbi:MAG: Na+/H+ antiporter NhaA, partial [Planctomycetota bacterium]
MTDHAPQGTERPSLPGAPIQKIVGPLTRFMHIEAASGVVLLIATCVALVLANTGASQAFLGFWQTQVGFRFGGFEFQHSLKHLINDGLMAIFFFVIGLEVKREIVVGELRDMRRAALPIAAAIGGMVVPAALYFSLQIGQPGQGGWGIPMATDIAFVVGCMAILGSRVPPALRITLLSLAIADDIGAILVIAIGYTEHVRLDWLATGFVGIGVIFGLSRSGVRSLLMYTILGTLVWFAFHESGVHATIAGVIMGLMTPARSYVSKGLFGQFLRRAEHALQGDWDSAPNRAQKLRKFQEAAKETISPVEYLENLLHPWVGFLIMPVFALANAGVVIEVSALGSRLALAVMLGLLVGK